MVYIIDTDLLKTNLRHLKMASWFVETSFQYTINNIIRLVFIPINKRRSTLIIDK
jgi:hypothetical protein